MQSAPHGDVVLFVKNVAYCCGVGVFYVKAHYARQDVVLAVQLYSAYFRQFGAQHFADLCEIALCSVRKFDIVIDGGYKGVKRLNGQRSAFEAFGYVVRLIDRDRRRARAAEPERLERRSVAHAKTAYALRRMQAFVRCDAQIVAACFFHVYVEISDRLGAVYKIEYTVTARDIAYAGHGRYYAGNV